MIFDENPFAGPEKVIVDGIERPPGGETLIQRDYRGRPYVYPIVDGVPDLSATKNTYTRVTTFVDAVDDKTMLHDWQMRVLMRFLATHERAEMYLLEAAVLDPNAPDYRKRMKRLVEDALNAAGAKDQARKGTAVHAITERYDLGLDVGRIPAKYREHLRTYIAMTRTFKMVEIERFVVNDKFLAGGTPDRVVQHLPCEKCGRRFFIEDLKTGRVDNYTEATIAMQMAMYRYSEFYDIATGKRSDIGDLCPHWAIIVHLPAQSNDPWKDSRLRRVDIERGWERVQFCAELRQVRADTKNWSTQFFAEPLLEEKMRIADSKATLHNIHFEHGPEFDPDLTRLMEQLLPGLP